MTYPKPFNESLEKFLCGPHMALLDVDDIFAKSLDVILTDLREFTPSDIIPDELDDGVRSLIRPNLIYREVMAGIILYDADKPIGGYLGCDLSLLPEYQGHGLGKEIVIERCIRDGDSPVWALDTAAYTHAGIAAHKSAWHHVRLNPHETELRMSRVYGGEDISLERIKT